MKKILHLAAKHPFWVLGCLLLVSLLAGSQLPRLEIHISPESLTIEGDPAKEFYEQSIATFGSDSITVLFLRDQNLFSPQNLEAVGSAVAALEQLPFVSRTQSLFSMPHLRVENDFVIVKPFLEEIPQTAEAAAEIVAAAAKSPFVPGNLLSEDGTSMAVNLYLDNMEDRPPGYETEVAQQIEAIVEPLSRRLESAFQVGLPYIRTHIRERIEQDQRTIMPLAVGVLLLTLALTLRRLNGAIIPLLTSGLSVLWTLGLMAGLGIPLNVMTAVVPVLLIVIGSTEDIHLIAEFYAGVRTGYLRRRALHYMIRRMGLAVLLTFFTSFMGFLSIATSPIELVREFGLVASLGLAINFSITALLVPAYLRVFGDRFPTVDGELLRIPGSHFVPILIRAALSKRRVLIAATMGVAAVALFFAAQIRVNNNVLNYFEPDSEVMQRVDTVHRNLAGLETFSIVVDGHIDGTFEKVRYLEEVRKLQRFLSRHPAFDFNVSFADYLALLNSVANDTGEPELPVEDEVIRELLLFVKHRSVAEYVSPDFSRTSIVVRHNIASSYELSQALTDMKAFVAANIDHDLDVRITGESILANNAADQMVEGQARSLLLMLLVIFAVIGLLFFNAKAGLLAIVPNLFLIVVLFGVMGYAAIPLDTGTAMIAAIALGVCVDHTMHFMVRYNRNLKELNDETEAIVSTIRDEATPITAASVALAAGLGTLSLSSFTPVIHFGILSAMVMLLAFYANFFITPIMLSYTRLVTLWDILSIQLRRELLENCELFKGMRPYQIKRIILLGQVRDYRKGERIMRAGEPSREIHILLSGQVRVLTLTDGKIVSPGRQLGPGASFGLVALVCSKTRLVTAAATEECRVLSLDWVRIQRLAMFYARTSAVFFRNISKVIGDRFRENLETMEAACQQPDVPTEAARTDVRKEAAAVF
jgi:predicted RND superfamily exporter protein/CRP-like cAMP-binding protein